MKTLIIITIALSFVLKSYSQDTLKANQIIEKINNIQDQHYKDYVIIGDFDLTKLQNTKKLDKKTGNNEYVNVIECDLYFENCKFLGDIIAYRWIDDIKSGYFVEFNNILSFSGCEFIGTIKLDYSTFNKEAKFELCDFDNQTSFKYSKFTNHVKYNKSIFHKYVDFEYVDFIKGVDLSYVQFKDKAKLCYVEFFNPTILTGVRFTDNIDTEYATIDKENFTDYLNKNK